MKVVVLQQWYNKIFLSIFLESVESSLFFPFNDFDVLSCQTTVYFWHFVLGYLLYQQYYYNYTLIPPNLLESSTPLLVFPEEQITNGKRGLMKFR